MGVFEAIGNDSHERVVVGNDPSTGLKAIIAIYSTELGPALGGTRLFPYQSDEAALVDALRLARAMALKASAAGLSLGGGKAVIIGDRTLVTDGFWRSYGRLIDSLGGAYITAEDVGTTTDDMRVIAQETEWVTGRAAKDDGGGDPSPVTARGVMRAMMATSRYLWDRDSLHGCRVAVQGVGKVGSSLVRHLVDEGADVVIADVRQESADALVEELGVKSVPTDEILAQDCDILSPCSLGGALNPETIPGLRCHAIVGSANNQLATDTDAAALAARDILYVPDFIANAAGLIHVASELDGCDAGERVESLYESVLTVLEQASEEGVNPHEAAVRFAEDRIRREGSGTTFHHGRGDQ